MSLQASLARSVNSFLGRDVFRVQKEGLGASLSHFKGLQKLTLDGDFAKEKLSNEFTSVAQLHIHVNSHTAPTDTTPLDDGICALIRAAEASRIELELINLPVSSTFCRKLTHVNTFLSKFSKILIRQVS